MIKVRKSLTSRVSQGDIFRDVVFVERVFERNGVLEITQIEFPLVIVLTQDCDLEQEHRMLRRGRSSSTHDKTLLSVLVAPLYNVEHVFAGEHLSELGLTMQEIRKNKTPGQNLVNNETPRYHYIEFPADIPIVPSAIDFKHYFSVGGEYLRGVRRKQFVCRVAELFREDVSQRFASYLSRIGLP